MTNTPVYDKFLSMNGLDLKVARLKANLKQYEMANLVGIPQTRIWEFETNRRVPAPEILQRIRRILADRGITLPPEGRTEE